MSLITGYNWTHKNVRLLGYSMAGISTSIAMPEADALFDVAQGLPFQVPIPNVLITHGHMDHASGLPYLIAMKGMMGQAPPNVFMPESLVGPMREIMRLWEKIDGHTYQFQFRALAPGESVPLKPPYFARTFPTFHRIPSQGYTVFERKKRLKDEFRVTAPHDLAELRRKGMPIEEVFEEPVFSFTGDTKIEFLDDKGARESKVLAMEVTYWDKKKSVENAREWGHIHLDELLPRLPDIKAEKILLIHASARYDSKYLREIIDARVPEHFKHRVELFHRPI